MNLRLYWIVAAVAVGAIMLRAAEVTGTTFETGGARIFYRDSGGNGIPVVFLHAATGTTDSWVKQYPVFIAAGFRCIAFYCLGGGGWSIAAQPGTAARVLRDTLC